MPAIRRLLSVLYLVAVTAVLFFAFRSDWPEVSDALASVSIGRLALAAALASGSLACSVAAWVIVLRSLGETISHRDGAGIFLVSQAGKYLPGSVWAAVAQVQMGKEKGVGRRANLASFFLALLLAMSSGVLVGVVAWGALEPFRFLWLGPAVMGALAVSVLALRQWPAVRQRLPAGIARRLPDTRPSAQPLAVATAVLCVGWVLNGLQFYVVADSLGLETDMLAVRSIAAFALAFVGGLLFVIAPAGAGVREGILVLFFGGAASVGVVAAAALVSRFIATMVDATGALIGVALGRASVQREIDTDLS